MARGPGTTMLILAAGLSLLAAGPACGQPEECGAQRNVRTGSLDESTWRQLNVITGEMGEARYGEAREDLLNMLGRAGRDGYLQAILNQALGQVESARGDDVAALGYFEAAVELDTLPDAAHYALVYRLAQLNFLQERYDAALGRLRLWFCATPPDKVTSAAWVLKASIHARQEDFAGVLEAIDAALALDQNPPEAWYGMKLAAHYRLEQYGPAAETLEVLVSRWPERKRYWLQLSQMLDRLGQRERALAVLALAWRERMLDAEADITYLSALYREAKVPCKAAEVLERGIREGSVRPSQVHWTLVGDAWYAADELEKSLAAYREAGKAAGDGLADLRRGYILVGLERWPAALEALNRALRKGGLDDRETGEAYLMRGMARFNLGDADSASADWSRAEDHDASREAAREWLKHLREEQARRARLTAG